MCILIIYVSLQNFKNDSLSIYYYNDISSSDIRTLISITLLRVRCEWCTFAVL